MYLLYPIIIPIINFFLQAYPRFYNKLFGVDVWTRLLETDLIRKNNHRIPKVKIKDQFIIDGYFDYPPVFPFLLSFIPKKMLLNIQGFIAPFIDSIQVLLVYITAFYLTGNITLSLLAQLFYMLTPMIAIENSYLTPRSFGYLNFSLASIPLIFYIYFNNPWFLAAGVFFATLLFVTHRFAMQSFLFLTIFFTFFLNTPVFIQSYIIGFILAVVLTKGYYIRVLKGHLFNIYFWIKNLDYRFAHQVRGIIKKQTKTDLVGKIYIFLAVFSPIAIFGLNPWSFSSFIIITARLTGWFPVSAILFTFAIWILFFYVFGVMVLKTKYLMPIGEGQRYMEMATVPSSILSAYIVFQLIHTLLRNITLFTVAGLCLLNFLVIIIIQMKAVIKDKNRSITKDLMNVFKFINKQKNLMRIICIPHQNTTMTIYHTKAQVFVNADNPGLMRVMDVYPILKLPLKKLAKKYNLTHALVKESFVTLNELKLSPKNVIFEAGDVKLVEL